MSNRYVIQLCYNKLIRMITIIKDDIDRSTRICTDYGPRESQQLQHRLSNLLRIRSLVSNKNYYSTIYNQEHQIYQSYCLSPKAAVNSPPSCYT